MTPAIANARDELIRAIREGDTAQNPNRIANAFAAYNFAILYNVNDRMQK